MKQQKKRWYEPISPTTSSGISPNDKPKPADNTTPRIEPGRKTYSGPPDLKSKMPTSLPGGTDSLMTREQAIKEWNKYYQRMGQKCKTKIGKNGNLETVCQ